MIVLNCSVKRLDLLARHVLAGQKYVFVKCHVVPFLLFDRRKASPKPWKKGDRMNFESGDTREDGSL